MLDTGLREILSKTTRQRTKEGGDERLAAHPVNTSPFRSPGSRGRNAVAPGLTSGAD